MPGTGQWETLHAGDLRHLSPILRCFDRLRHPRAVAAGAHVGVTEQHRQDPATEAQQVAPECPELQVVQPERPPCAPLDSAGMSSLLPTCMPASRKPDASAVPRARTPGLTPQAGRTPTAAVAGSSFASHAARPHRRTDGRLCCPRWTAESRELVDERPLPPFRGRPSVGR